MSKNSQITVHCLVRNEEVFVGPAILSVIDFADRVIIFDTGSTDGTVRMIEDIKNKYPNKIVFEEKGPCDKRKHTELRQEMIDRTDTEWFMILDGDEVWTEAGLNEVVKVCKDPKVECIMAPFYLCVGDIYHRTNKKGSIEMLGVKDFFYPRVIRKIIGIKWRGDYNEDTLVNSKGQIFFNKDNSVILKNRFWHLTHLMRSSQDDLDYSSGGTRSDKRKLTYFIIGRRISESVPKQLIGMKPLGYFASFVNFIKLVFKHLWMF
jgi:glycosyltransferase involved in cell wall biosynthesis